MSQVDLNIASSEIAATHKARLDTRGRQSFWSVVIIAPALSAVLLFFAGFGLANDSLLKLATINVIAGLGVGLFCGGTGILSLAHISFFGIGAYVASWFTIPPAIKGFLLPSMPFAIQQADWPLWLALVPAVAAAVLVGLLTGVVMRRLRDTAAVIASFGFLIISYLLFIGLKPLTNGKQSLYSIPRDALGWPLILVALVVALIVAYAAKASIAGRNAEATREDEQAARSIGIVSDNSILFLWVVSAAIMGLAGALFVHVVGVAAPSAFYLDKTFALIVMVIIGGYRSLTGAVVGAVIVTFAEEVFKKTEEFLGGFAGQELIGGIVMPQVFGLTALAFSVMILLVLYYRPDGIAGYKEVATLPWVQRRLDGWFGTANSNIGPAHYRVSETARLKTVDLHKSYGGFVAMSGTNLEVKAGQIVGLIGPNGAGKSTFINVITGNLFATSGSISLNDQDATLWSANKLAKSGMGRTFQNIRVFGSLSVLENVLTAVNVARPELGSVAAEDKARAWLHALNLDAVAQTSAEALAYGDQRRLEIARALALEPDFLLLDEPVAGMNHQETEALTALLRQVVADIGCGILLVEHDLPMVMALCDHIYVVNKGEQIADGTPAEIRANPVVIEAYIGQELDDPH